MADADEGFERGRAAWPEVALSRERFAAFRLARAEAEPQHAPDLYLAAGCADGDAAALRALDRLLAEVAAAVARRGHGADVLDEAKQRLRVALLTARPGGPPRIAGYGGRAPLRVWLRVGLAREAVRAEPSSRETPVEANLLAEALAAGDDVEHELLRRTYGAAFRTAFADAIAALDRGQRRLLRWAYVAQHTVDELGALLRVSRATAARRVDEARRALAAQTRAILVERLGVDGSELDSIFRLVDSQLDLSVRRLLD